MENKQYWFCEEIRASKLSNLYVFMLKRGGKVKAVEQTDTGYAIYVDHGVSLQTIQNGRTVVVPEICRMVSSIVLEAGNEKE